MENPFELIERRLKTLEELILDLKSQPKEQADNDVFFGVKEAAEYLNLTVSTVYQNALKGKLPVIKRGKKLYFSKKELTAYLLAGRKKTVAEIEQEVQNYINKKGGVL
jgi:excisionase family DNA binding protein